MRGIHPQSCPIDQTAGWQARLDLTFAERAGRTVLTRKQQSGPLTVQRPFYPEGGPCHCYLLHPPGGVVGGDRLEIHVEVRDRAHALLTTPGAAKFYRSSGARAEQAQRLMVEAGGVLEWLPQEGIVFPGARLRLTTEVDLEPGARFMGWEVLSFGRPAIGERFHCGVADLGLSVRRAGVPLLLERLRLSDGEGLDAVSGLRGHPVSGTLVASGAEKGDLEALRDGRHPDAGLLWGATLLDDLLVVRCLAGGVEPVHRLFRSIWGILRPRLFGAPVCPPRIWAT